MSYEMLAWDINSAATLVNNMCLKGEREKSRDVHQYE